MSKRFTPAQTGKCFYTNDETFCECDKLTENNHVIKHDVEHKGMKVILEFPQESKDNNSIKEVKLILSEMLQEHFDKHNDNEKARKTK